MGTVTEYFFFFSYGFFFWQLDLWRVYQIIAKKKCPFWEYWKLRPSQAGFSHSFVRGGDAGICRCLGEKYLFHDVGRVHMGTCKTNIAYLSRWHSTRDSWAFREATNLTRK